MIDLALYCLKQKWGYLTSPKSPNCKAKQLYPLHQKGPRYTWILRRLWVQQCVESWPSFQLRMGKMRVTCSNGTLSTVFFLSSGWLNPLRGRTISWERPWPFSRAQPLLATWYSRNLSRERPSMLMACTDMKWLLRTRTSTGWTKWHLKSLVYAVSCALALGEKEIFSTSVRHWLPNETLLTSYCCL